MPRGAARFFSAGHVGQLRRTLALYFADVRFWLKRPAIVVYDSDRRAARRVLNRDETVYPENFLVRNPIRPMRYFGGSLEMKTCVDGVAASHDGRWV